MSENNNKVENKVAPRDEVMDWMAFMAIGLFMAWMLAQCATP